MTMCPAADLRISSAHRLIISFLLGWLLLFGIQTDAFAQRAEVTPPADAPALSVTFIELNDSGVSGVATLYADGDQTIVDITVEDAGPIHPAHIHAGTCDDLTATPEYTLENVVDGSSISIVDVSLDDLLASDFSIDLHLSPDELGTMIVCAPIEGNPTAGTETPVSVGGTGSQSGDGTGGAQMGEDMATLPLPGLDDNGVTGILSLTKLDDERTDVIIQLSGDAITGDHIAHLHFGTCDNLQDEGTIDLMNVDATGLSETTVDVPFEDLLSNGYAVNVHESETNYDTWLTCAEFSDATVGAVVPEVAPDTGSGSAIETPIAEPTAEPTIEPTPSTRELPATAGTGFGLPGPDAPISASFWAIFLGGSILILGAIAIRKGERTKRATRWPRLGL